MSDEETQSWFDFQAAEDVVDTVMEEIAVQYNAAEYHGLENVPAMQESLAALRASMLRGKDKDGNDIPLTAVLRPTAGIVKTWLIFNRDPILFNQVIIPLLTYLDAVIDESTSMSEDGEIEETDLKRVVTVGEFISAFIWILREAELADETKFLPMMLVTMLTNILLTFFVDLEADADYTAREAFLEGPFVQGVAPVIQGFAQRYVPQSQRDRQMQQQQMQMQQMQQQAYVAQQMEKMQQQANQQKLVVPPITDHRKRTN